MLRINHPSNEVAAGKAVEHIFADIDSENNFGDDDTNVAFLHTDYISQDKQDKDCEYDLHETDLTLNDRPMDTSPIPDEQQGGTEDASDVRSMSTISGCNSNEDQYNI